MAKAQAHFARVDIVKTIAQPRCNDQAKARWGLPKRLRDYNSSYKTLNNQLRMHFTSLTKSIQLQQSIRAKQRKTSRLTHPSKSTTTNQVRNLP